MHKDSPQPAHKSDYCTAEKTTTYAVENVAEIARFSGIALQRASISVASDAPEEQAAFDAWLGRWRMEMTFISEDHGCGCCVHLDVEGPKESIDAIPEPLRTMTDWSKEGVRR